MYQKKYVATRIGCSGGIDSYLKTIRYVEVQEERDYNRYFFLDDDKNVTVDYYSYDTNFYLVIDSKGNHSLVNKMDVRELLEAFDSAMEALEE